MWGGGVGPPRSPGVTKQWPDHKGPSHRCCGGGRVNGRRRGGAWRHGPRADPEGVKGIPFLGPPWATGSGPLYEGPSCDMFGGHLQVHPPPPLPRHPQPHTAGGGMKDPVSFFYYLLNAHLCPQCRTDHQLPSLSLQPPSISLQPPSISLQPPSVSVHPPSVRHQPPAAALR